MITLRLLHIQLACVPTAIENNNKIITVIVVDIWIKFIK